MAYFPDTMPRPVPTMDDAGFWAACSERKLRFQACADCDRPRHPPTPVCPACHSTRMKWIDAPARAEVFTFNVIHHASHPAVSGRLPYVGALITFPDLPGVRLVSNVTDCAPSEVRIGMQVELWWDDIGGGLFLPRFRPTGGDAS
jgi:uncharacterized OB-fold protein